MPKFHLGSFSGTHFFLPCTCHLALVFMPGSPQQRWGSLFLSGQLIICALIWLQHGLCLLLTQFAPPSRGCRSEKGTSKTSCKCERRGLKSKSWTVDIFVFWSVCQPAFTGRLCSLGGRRMWEKFRISVLSLRACVLSGRLNQFVWGKRAWKELLKYGIYVRPGVATSNIYGSRTRWVRWARCWALGRGVSWCRLEGRARVEGGRGYSAPDCCSVAVRVWCCHVTVFWEKLDIWFLDEISWFLKWWGLIQIFKKTSCGPNQTYLQAESGQRPQICSVWTRIIPWSPGGEISARV